MQVAFLFLLCIIGVWGGLSPCLTNSFAPITTSQLASSLSSSFVFPDSSLSTPLVQQLTTIVGYVAAAMIPGTEDEAALFFATPVANQLFVRTRNCTAPEWGVPGDACHGRTDRIYEIFCPGATCLADQNNHVYTYDTDSATLTTVGTFTLVNPTVYNGGGAQFWFPFGSNGGSGWLSQPSGIPELNANFTDASVFVVPAYKGSTLVAVVGAIRSEDEPCTPPVNCVLGAWSSYGACSAVCGGGFQHRTRAAIVNAQNGGSCGALGQEQQCNTQLCYQDLTGRARAGVVIACICSAVLAGLIFFSWAKSKKVFTTKSKAQRKAAAAAAAAANKRQQQEQQAQAKQAAMNDHTGEDDEVVVAELQPVKTVHIWV